MLCVVIIFRPSPHSHTAESKDPRYKSNSLTFKQVSSMLWTKKRPVESYFANIGDQDQLGATLFGQHEIFTSPKRPVLDTSCRVNLRHFQYNLILW